MSEIDFNQASEIKLIPKLKQGVLPMPPAIVEGDDGLFHVASYHMPREDDDDTMVMQLDESGKIKKKRISQGEGSKNKGGRPPNPGGPLVKQMIVELTEELHSGFKALCIERGVSMSQAVREWIEQEVGKGVDAQKIRRVRMQNALNEYRRLGGTKMEQLLQMFREMEKIQEIEEVVGDGK